MSTRIALLGLGVVAGTAFAQAPAMVYRAEVDAGTNFDYGTDAETDALGDVFVLGYSYSDTTNGDVSVTKLSPSGELMWQMRMPGSQLDVPGGLAVDADGDAYFCGRTLSSDLPIMNAIQPFRSGPQDGFLIKLSGQDGSVLMGTYLGGSRADGAGDVAIAPDGSIVVVGETDSINFPTMNPIQDSLTLIDCFCDDMFVTRLSPDGQTITFSTYLGGTYDDKGARVLVDTDGQIVVAGYTASPDFPTQAAFQSHFRGGDSDCFVARLDPESPAIVYSSFLGGEDLEYVQDMEMTPSGSVYVGGYTQSVQFPTTAGALQTTFVGGLNACGDSFTGFHNCSDGFVTRVGPMGALEYSTFMGGSGEDQVTGVGVGPDGAVSVDGYAFSGDFPGLNPSGAYVSQLNESLGELAFSVNVATGGSPNGAHGLAVGPDGTTIFAGAVGIPTGPNTIQRDLLVVAYDTGTGCPADMVAPFGVLDLSDVQAFIAAFVAGDPMADLAEPAGVLDLADVQVFVSSFMAGCP